MNGRRSTMRGWRWWASFLAAVLLTACNPPSDGPSRGSAKPASDSVSVMIDSVNYMHERGVGYTVYDLSTTPPRAIGGAIVDRLGSGGEKGCCIALPSTWRAGLKVRLVWRESDLLKTYEDQTRDMEVPRYDSPADLYVVFYPGHEVELVVSAGEPGHPEWRGKIKQTPWEQCVQTYTRKPCFAALPKQFDSGTYQGYCARVRRDPEPNSEQYCEDLMLRCMRDFEEKPYCDAVLWGPEKR